MLQALLQSKNNQFEKLSYFFTNKLKLLISHFDNSNINLILKFYLCFQY